jgi:uncharacterized protein YydD (DUF2326 family)
MKRTHRKKELTEVQVLKHENRELRAELNKVRRQLKQLEKARHIYDEHTDEPEEPIAIEIKCPQCYAGDIKTIDLGIKIMQACESCSYRKVINK